MEKLLQSAPARGPTLLHPHTSTLTPAPALLATDLLQVEAHLQSRVRLLEGEKQDLSSRLLEVERSLFQTRGECRSLFHARGDFSCAKKKRWSM